MTFDWFDFIAPLDPFVIIMALILGVSLGVVLRLMHHSLTQVAIFWQVAGGAIFFIPLSLLRALQGSGVWERFLATFILWVLFIFGMWVGTRVSPSTPRGYK